MSRHSTHGESFSDGEVDVEYNDACDEPSCSLYRTRQITQHAACNSATDTFMHSIAYVIKWCSQNLSREWGGIPSQAKAKTRSGAAK